MYIIGERLNTSIPEISKAVKSRDKDKILEEAVAQVEAGASALDINAGTHGRTEEDDVLWLLDVIQDGANVTLSLDSSNPAVIDVCLNKYKGPGSPIINSISGESAKLNALTNLLKDHDSQVISLAINDSGIPESPAERVEIIAKIIEHLESEGVSKKRIFADPLVFPISTDTKKAISTINTLQEIKKRFPEVRTIVGLSNISFGLPKMKLLNRTFLAMLLASGLDAAILDPTMEGIMSTVRASKVLLNQDDYCADYISAYRNGKL